MKSYKELIVWQKSIVLVKEIYILTKKFPKEEIFGLTSQIRRASISIPANIAEGFARAHRQENIQFLKIALGSAAELETHLIIASQIGLISNEELTKSASVLEEICKMLNKMATNLRNTSS